MPEHRPLRGIGLMLLAILCFSMMDASIKYLTVRIPIPLMLWVRYLGQLLLMVVTLGPSMRGRLLATRRPWSMTVRGIWLLLTSTLGMLAFRALPLAEATAVIFLSPLLVALLAGPVLGEQVGWRRWLALGIGFFGVLLIARPGGQVGGIGLLWALAGALAYASYQLHTRRLSPTENTWTLLFYTALVGTVATTLALPLYWTTPTIGLVDGVLLGMLGVLGGVGHFLLTRAFRHAPAATLSPVLYTQLIWAALLGAAIFDHWPDGPALLGMGLIAASSLGLTLIEQRRAMV